MQRQIRTMFPSCHWLSPVTFPCWASCRHYCVFLLMWNTFFLWMIPNETLNLSSPEDLSLLIHIIITYCVKIIFIYNTSLTFRIITITHLYYFSVLRNIYLWQLYKIIYDLENYSITVKKSSYCWIVR